MLVESQQFSMPEAWRFLRCCVSQMYINLSRAFGPRLMGSCYMEVMCWSPRGPPLRQSEQPPNWRPSPPPRVPEELPARQAGEGLGSRAARLLVRTGAAPAPEQQAPASRVHQLLLHLSSPAPPPQINHAWRCRSPLLRLLLLLLSDTASPPPPPPYIPLNSLQ